MSTPITLRLNGSTRSTAADAQTPLLCARNQLDQHGPRFVVARYEEVRVDATHVSSVDGQSYPILDMTEVPDSIELVIVGNVPGRSYGAGEPSTRPLAAALANALFDAPGARLRRVPLTPERLLAAMRAPLAT